MIPAPGERFGSEWEGPRGSASSGSDNRGQGRQIHVLPPVVLATFTNDAEGNTGDVSFRVEVPDSRLRVGIEIVGVPGNGNSDNAFIGTKGLTLWLRAVANAIQGGREIPMTNLWGTAAAPGPIPGDIIAGVPTNDPDLGAWGKEFVTIGRAIVGTISYADVVQTGVGQLALQVYYTPEAIRFPDYEWQEIKAQCGSNCVGPTLDNAG